MVIYALFPTRPAVSAAATATLVGVWALFGTANVLMIDRSFFNVPLLKQPEMRLQRSGYSPTMFEPGYREGLSYEKAEVRALMFAQIKEVVEEYVFEGLELDWWRQPLCCEPNATPHCSIRSM